MGYPFSEVIAIREFGFGDRVNNLHNQSRSTNGSRMNSRNNLKCLAVLLLAGAVSLPAFADDTAKAEAKPDSAAPDQAQMMATMMAMTKPGENHKILAGTVGTWSYKVKYWMSPDPKDPPMESSGTSVTKSIMEGRYFVSEHTGKMQMPGADGKLMDTEFKGMSTDGYDNAKKKFVSSWVDNMGTGIMASEGTYDAATKTLTYKSEYEPMPGMKIKMRQTVALTDNDHHKMEFYEDRGGQEVKSMEITYVRKS
jgi:hypothetical protein